MENKLHFVRTTPETPDNATWKRTIQLPAWSIFGMCFMVVLEEGHSSQMGRRDHSRFFDGRSHPFPLVSVSSCICLWYKTTKQVSTLRRPGTNQSLLWVVATTTFCTFTDSHHAIQDLIDIPRARVWQPLSFLPFQSGKLSHVRTWNKWPLQIWPVGPADCKLPPTIPNRSWPLIVLSPKNCSHILNIY